VQGRGQLPEDHVAQDFGRVVVILGRVLDEAEAVDVADDGLAVGTEQVEPADRLEEVRTSASKICRYSGPWGTQFKPLSITVYEEQHMGAMTITIMTFSITINSLMILGIMILSIMALGIMTIGIMILSITTSGINDILHSDTQHNYQLNL